MICDDFKTLLFYVQEKNCSFNTKEQFFTIYDLCPWEQYHIMSCLVAVFYHPFYGGFNAPTLLAEMFKTLTILIIIVYPHPISLYRYSLNLNSVYNGIDHTWVSKSILSPTFFKEVFIASFGLYLLQN